MDIYLPVDMDIEEDETPRCPIMTEEEWELNLKLADEQISAVEDLG